MLSYSSSERRKSLDSLPTTSAAASSMTPSRTSRNSFRNKSMRNSKRAKAHSTSTKPNKQGNYEISKPFEFKLITHVELDKKTNKLIGLPPEWIRILEQSGVINKEEEPAKEVEK